MDNGEEGCPSHTWGVADEGSVHRPLKIRTDDSQSRVRELGSIGIFVFLL